MSLDEAVKEIVNKSFSEGQFFDSHTVINEIIKDKNYHAVYLEGYSRDSVALYHAMISQLIRDCGCVERVGDSMSHTIYGDISKNALWKKL